MKKLPVILLLAVALLLSACEAEQSTDSAGDKTSAATTTDEKTATEGNVTTTLAVEDEMPNEPEATVDYETFADLIEKFPVVSAPTGSFASATSSEKIGEAVEKMEAWEGGVMQFKASISANMGSLGSQEEQITATLTMLDDAYQSVTETISTGEGERITVTQSQTYVDDVYYYLYQMDGDDESTEKYKVTMSLDDFKENILGETEEIGDVDDVELSQFITVVDEALRYTAGMTEEGGCTYFAKGLSADALADIDLLEDMVGELGFGLTEDCLSEIATVITLDSEGDLKGIYFDLPLELSIEEGGLSMTMSMSIQMELTVRAAAAEDKVEAPADADSYEELSFDDVFDPDNWFDDAFAGDETEEDIFGDEDDSSTENTAL